MDKHHCIKSFWLPQTTLCIKNKILITTVYKNSTPTNKIIRYLFSCQAVDRRPSAYHVSGKLHSFSSCEASLSNSYFKLCRIKVAKHFEHRGISFCSLSWASQQQNHGDTFALVPGNDATTASMKESLVADFFKFAWL